MKRVLLLLPTTGYRNDDFVAAARTAGRRDRGGGRLLPPTRALLGPASHHGAAFRPARAGGGDRSALARRQPGCGAGGGRFGRRTCSAALRTPGLPANPAARGAPACATSWRSAGCSGSRAFRVPNSITGRAARIRGDWSPDLKFPVVVKARRLSGSRGVIRADDSAALVRAVDRVRAIQSQADRDAQRTGPDHRGLHSRDGSTRWKAAWSGASSRRWPCSTSPILWTGRTSRKPSTSRRPGCRLRVQDGIHRRRWPGHAARPGS